MNKYPPKFDMATHGLVVGTYSGDGYLFEGGCEIVRRLPGKLAISSPCGATFTFSIKEQGVKRRKEYGTLIQVHKKSRQNSEFKVIPYNGKFITKEN